MPRLPSVSTSLVLGLGGLIALSPAGCGSDVETAPTSAAATTTGTTGASTGQGGSGGGPTTSSASTTTTTTTGAGGATCIETPGLVLAVNRLYVGDTNPDDSPDAANAWKQYGFDLDGKTSTGASVDLCQPNAGAAPSNVYPDGNDGKDNSFGNNVLPLLLGFAPDAAETINQSIQSGDFTLMLRMDDIGPGADSGPFSSLVYGGAVLGSAPAFDGSDCWPVLPEQLEDPVDIDSAQTEFPASSVAGNVWTSGSTDTLTLTLNIAGFPVPFVLHEARLSLELEVDHEGAVGGQLGGVLDTEAFVEAMRSVAGTFDPSLCSGSTFDSIANQLRQASDIMNDGTQDPAQVCNGISVGFGFKMKRVQLGGVATPVPPAPDPCP
jgi:hypothetical protein